MRFASARDFQRSLERALRRAHVPVAYTQGFSPHPRISYAPAVPTGVASEAEYVEVAMQQTVTPDELAEALDAALPDGFDVLSVVEAQGESLGERVSGPGTGSVWRIRFGGIAASDLEKAVAEVLALTTWTRQRTTKSGHTQIDVRTALISASVVESDDDEPDCAILQAVVRHGTPSVRPDDVLAVLRDVAGLDPPVPPVATRLAQGPLDEESGAVLDPLS
jgi:radical SAM-linked protein